MQDARRFRTQVEILKHRHPELVIDLITAPAASAASVAQISDLPEGPCLKWRDKAIHSVKAPEAEARRVLEKQDFHPGQSFIVFGCGLGHLPAAVMKRLPSNTALIVIEPEIQIFREVLGSVDLRQFLFDERIFWVSGRHWRDMLKIVMRRCEDAGRRPATTLLHLPSYRNYFAPQMREARSIIAQFLNERDIDTDTRKHLWDLWNRNLVENLPNILSSTPLRDILHAFRGVPAVLVGAGPSLDDNIADLPRLRERALIIAVDTALGPMLSVGCEPDLVLAMDAQEENDRDFHNLPDHRSVLLFDAFCYPAIPKRYAPASRITSQTGHVLTDVDDMSIIKNCMLPMLDHLLGVEIGFLQNGGSVITAAFDFARITGCSPIALVGADFSFPDFQTHTRRTQRHDHWTRTSTRMDTFESKVWDYVSQKTGMTLQNYDGNVVRSDRVLTLYKHWMEDAARKTRLPCFNLGVCRGARIEGYPRMSVDDFLRQSTVDRSQIEKTLRTGRHSHMHENPGVHDRLSEIRRAMDDIDADRPVEHVGVFPIDRYVEMASFEVAERLRTVLAAEPESEHPVRRRQAARACKPIVTRFLDAFEKALAGDGY